MLLDRHYMKDRRGWKYYLPAFAPVVAWNILVFALVGHHNSPVKWLTILATLALIGIPIIGVLLLDYYKDWRSWHYYLLAFVNVAAIYVLWALLITHSGLTTTPVRRGNEVTKSSFTAGTRSPRTRIHSSSSQPADAQPSDPLHSFGHADEG